MALKNKDGSFYKLAGPNPIMKDQQLWADGNYELHNMNWDVETQKAKSESNYNVKVPIKDSFLQELEKTKIEEKISDNSIVEEKLPIKVYEIEKKEEIIERKSIVKPDLKKQEEENDSELEKTFIHCLPATIRTTKDDLYGDVYQTIKYGQPTSFEAIILDQQDFTMTVWTDTDKISIGSVLYPKCNFKRWWRVKAKEKKANGWIIVSIPSDYQPSFER